MNTYPNMNPDKHVADLATAILDKEDPMGPNRTIQSIDWFQGDKRYNLRKELIKKDFARTAYKLQEFTRPAPLHGFVFNQFYTLDVVEGTVGTLKKYFIDKASYNREVLANDQTGNAAAVLSILSARDPESAFNTSQIGFDAAFSPVVGTYLLSEDETENADRVAKFVHDMSEWGIERYITQLGKRVDEMKELAVESAPEEKLGKNDRRLTKRDVRINSERYAPGTTGAPGYMQFNRRDLKLAAVGVALERMRMASS